MIRTLLGVALLAGCATSIPESIIASSAGNATYEIVEGSAMYRMLGPGAIPPVDHPTWASVEQADAFMDDEEPVIVVERGGESRVYSTWYLEGHEVVNDTIGTEALLVSW